MNICCVLVTYGNRSLFVQKLVYEVIKQGIEKIIIVDNGSSRESSLVLGKLALERASIIQLISLGKNIGSAIGFSCGIQAALKTNMEILWLLDDDNLPATDAIDALRQQWHAITTPNKNVSVALCSFRKDRKNFVCVARERNPAAVLPLPNSFMGFHVKKLFTLTKERFMKSREHSDFHDGVFEINACAYGGFWFHKDLCSKIGLPNEEYVLYMDDFDYTYRLKLRRGQIFMVCKSLITDMETSYYLPSKKSIYYHSLLEARSEAIAYYTCRNVIFFTRQYLLTNKFVYWINKIIFIVIITALSSLQVKFHRLKTIYKAVVDGESGKMGFHYEYSLAN